MTEGTQKHPPIRVKSVDAIGREVRRLAYRLWQHEFTGALWLVAFRPRYEVPGRRRNGSVKGKRPIRWLLGRIMLPVRSVIASVISVFFDGDIATTRRTSTVRGEQNCQALAFADANKSEQESLVPDSLWLLHSRDCAILCKLKTPETSPTIEVLWSADGASKPEIDTNRRVISWSDGSSVELSDK
ncbi:MAG: hypothetical protein ACRDQ7_08680 [Haloechinothrix sp.]